MQVQPIFNFDIHFEQTWTNLKYLQTLCKFVQRILKLNLAKFTQNCSKFASIHSNIDNVTSKESSTRKIRLVILPKEWFGFESFCQIETNLDDL